MTDDFRIKGKEEEEQIIFPRKRSKTEKLIFHLMYVLSIYTGDRYFLTVTSDR